MESQDDTQEPLPRESLKRKTSRSALTDNDRRNIRRQYSSHPSSQTAVRLSYEKQPSGRLFTQGQISKILSDKYAYLDTTNMKPKDLAAKRHYKGDFPDLEAALFEWQQRMQKKDAVITQDILKAKAKEIWGRLPQYNEVESPKWSNGWLEGFKKRFKFKEYVRHGEASSADINNPAVITQMDELRALCATYQPRDILNMDETGLFWKLTPDRTLATQAVSGGKKSKDRITVALTANADGSEKLEPWIIGRSKNPRCLKNLNRSLLRVKYSYNKSKWMTGTICEEYLRWLDNKMHGRRVLLLMDNFSGHELGVQLVGGLEGLRNVRIAWLPANTTSFWQPLDQGIIASFKLYYRRLWMAYYIRQLDAGRDPNKTVSLLKAIQWTRLAWAEYVTSSTIEKCFWKSTITVKPANIDTASPIIETEERALLQADIKAIPGFTDTLTIDEFLEPQEERIEDEEEDILESVVQMYRVTQAEEESEEEGDEEFGRVSINEAIQALETLRLYELQQENGSRSTLHALDRIGRGLTSSKAQNTTQITIDGFFKRQ
jgi:hypothetical protein